MGLIRGSIQHPTNRTSNFRIGDAEFKFGLQYIINGYISVYFCVNYRFSIPIPDPAISTSWDNRVCVVWQRQKRHLTFSRWIFCVWWYILLTSPSWQGLTELRLIRHLMKCPSHNKRDPDSVEESIWLLGNSTKEWMSVSSTCNHGLSRHISIMFGLERATFPNFPLSPCSFSPVNVDAIFQKRMWPVPAVVNRPSFTGENLTLYTSWPNA